MPRLVAVDLARFLAVVGMMGAHLLHDAPGWALVATTGFPSAAFAVIGGASAVLATQRYTGQGRHLAAAVSLGSRGLLVALLGVALEPLSGPIIVVLAYFGTGLVCLALLLRLPTWALLGLAAALALLGPPLTLAVRTALDDPVATQIDTGSALRVLASLGFTGFYPVVTWLVYLLVGAAVGRLLVARSPERTTPRPALLLVGAGAVGLLAALLGDVLTGESAAPGERGEGAPVGTGVRLLLDTTPHSGSLGDLVRTTGVACLVLGLLLLVTRSGDRVPPVLRPARSAGAAPLTVYTLHVLVFGLLTSLAQAGGNSSFLTDEPDWWLGGPVALLLNVAGALLVGAVLARWRSRGLLEVAVGTLAELAASVTDRRDARARA